MLHPPLFTTNILPWFVPSLEKLKLLQAAMVVDSISNPKPWITGLIIIFIPCTILNIKVQGSNLFYKSKSIIIRPKFFPICSGKGVVVQLQMGSLMEILTLAPPTTTSSSKCKHSQSILINPELAYQVSLKHQLLVWSHIRFFFHPSNAHINLLKASFEDSILWQGVTGTGSGSIEHQAYYSFLMVPIDQATTLTMANCNGEVGDLDLNLKP